MNACCTAAGSATLIAALLSAAAPSAAAAQMPTPASELAPLARAIGDRRIVLLGENGHGVGELTTMKVRLVEWLHRELGFEVVVMESGFFECGHAWRRAQETTPREMLYDCLRYPFQHAEILPLFQLMHASRAAGRPLELAGMDPQTQGFDSGERPDVRHAALTLADPALARRVAAFDSLLFLVPDSGGLGDSTGTWLLEHGAAVRAAYDSAAAVTSGFERWSFRLAAGLVDRLLVRAGADRLEQRPPAAYYALRDEWMARAVAAISDSIAGERKVIVWLHNDHARYGDFHTDGSAVRPVGSHLREWYGDDVYSIGFFMGRGTVADNRRRRREMPPPPAGGIEQLFAAAEHQESYLLLTGAADPAVSRWAASPRPYLRMGLDRREMVPAAEFDALFYVDSVGPPGYE